MRDWTPALRRRGPYRSSPWGRESRGVWEVEDPSASFCILPPTPTSRRYSGTSERRSATDEGLRLSREVGRKGGDRKRMGSRKGVDIRWVRVDRVEVGWRGSTGALERDRS